MAIHEECGVFGIYDPAGSCAQSAYYGLYALQHRGQESCGIVVNDDGIFVSHKDLGLVSEVFPKDVLAGLPEGKMAVGHVRYGTTGGNNRNNCQPIEVNHQKGRMALAHNGNLSNAAELRSKLELSGAIFHSTSDTETIAYIVTRERLRTPSIEDALSAAMNTLDGAYSLVLMSPQKLICARDPYGFRPLCYGKTADGMYVVASESCALKAVGADFIRDVEPGEIVVVDPSGVKSIRDHCTGRISPCIFEYIYFARTDSVIDGVSVYEARKEAGRLLARQHPVKGDLVIGVPESGIDAAIGYSEESGIPYEKGIVKNNYIGRTFIKPTQQERRNSVRIKLNPLVTAVKGKRIVMLDDSIVRGTTCDRIVSMLREAGAKEVHLRISSPPFTWPCYYGTDIPSKNELIACKMSVEEIGKLSGADSIGFLELDSLCQMIGKREKCFCDACFTGNYPAPVPKHIMEGKPEQRCTPVHR